MATDTDYEPPHVEELETALGPAEVAAGPIGSVE